MVGGSETTATVMCGTLFGLLTAPNTYKKLVKEIRSAYKDSSKITPASVVKLDYLALCINEGLRMLTPTPGNLRRVTPPGGCTIAGWDVPGNTLVAVDCWPAFHSESNFYRPEQFAPERWQTTPPAEFANDNLKVMQGFSVGPRNCIGKNLALLEMKLVLANLFLNFDIQVMPESGNYVNELEVYCFFKREEFWVKMTPVIA